MYKFFVQTRRLFCFLGIISLFFVFQNNIYATSYERANVLVGPISSDPDSIYVDDENFALDSLKNVMSTHDLMLAMVYVSEYRKGDKTVEENLRTLIAKYNFQNIDQIMNYILKDNKVRLLASFKIDHATNTLTFVPISGLTASVDSNITLMANALWKYIVDFAPAEFSNSITTLHLELNKDDDNMATLCESSSDASTWDAYIDIRLLDLNKLDEIYKNIIYLTTFYYILRTDQIEFLTPKKECYQYAGHIYKDKSYINTFYKKFWKGRRKEVNTSQYELYKNEFINSKASRTVYDDMAVSFYSYVQNGIMKRYLGFRADKNNFFYDYPLFKDLAKQFRLKLKIRVS